VSHNGGQRQQRIPTESVAFHSQYATLVVAQQQTLLTEFLQ
jgi:hypothetical protein